MIQTLLIDDRLLLYCVMRGYAYTVVYLRDMMLILWCFYFFGPNLSDVDLEQNCRSSWFARLDFSKGLAKIRIPAQKTWHILEHHCSQLGNGVHTEEDIQLNSALNIPIIPGSHFGMREVAMGQMCFQTTTFRERLLCPKDPATVADGRWPDSSILASLAFWSMLVKLDGHSMGGQVCRITPKVGSWRGTYSKAHHRYWMSEGAQNSLTDLDRTCAAIAFVLVVVPCDCRSPYYSSCCFCFLVVVLFIVGVFSSFCCSWFLSLLLSLLFWFAFVFLLLHRLFLITVEGIVNFLLINNMICLIVCLSLANLFCVFFWF